MRVLISFLLLFATVGLYAQEITVAIAGQEEENYSNNKVLTDRDFVYTYVTKPTQKVPLDKNAILIYDKEGVVSSYNLKERKINWSVKADDAINMCGNKLTLHEGVVYVPFTNGQIYALDNQTGEMFWKSRLGKNEGVVIKNQLPIIHNNLLHIVANNNNQNIYALDIKEGKNVWNYRLAYPYNHIPLLHFNEMIFATNAPYVYGFQAKTGKLLSLAGPFRQAMYGKPVTDGERVIIPDESDMLYAFNPQNMAIQWDFELDKNQYYIKEKIFCKGNNVYFAGNSMVYSLNSKTGKTEWKTEVKERYILHLTEYGKSLWGYTKGGLFFELDYSGNKLREVQLENKPISNLEFSEKETIYYYSDNGLIKYNLAKNKEELIYSKQNTNSSDAYIKIVR